MEKVRSGGDRAKTWSDSAFGSTEFLCADYRDFAFPPHVHETFAIGIIETGGQRFRPARASSLVMPAGTLCAINPGVVHEGRSATQQGWRYRMFYPSPVLVARVLESEQGSLGKDFGLDRHVLDDPELYHEFEELHVASQLRESLLERETRITAFLRRLFERHGNVLPKRGHGNAAPRTVGIVRDYLHANVENQVSVSDLALAAGVSDTQVIRAFSAATGMPPHSYLVSLRVERAKAALRAGSSPAMAAYTAGFSDQSQMNRHFKRLTGTTPGRFAAEVSPSH
jgi:AraC-like DNA-binding protein